MFPVYVNGLQCGFFFSFGVVKISARKSLCYRNKHGSEIGDSLLILNVLVLEARTKHLKINKQLKHSDDIKFNLIEI